MSDSHEENRPIKSSLVTDNDLNKTEKHVKFNEKNLGETYHPENKNYGFQVITEPKTPYPRNVDLDDSEEDEQDDLIDQLNIMIESEAIKRDKYNEFQKKRNDHYRGEAAFLHKKEELEDEIEKEIAQQEDTLSKDVSNQDKM
ncbi:MAG: protein phosphatase inhibitor activity [Paramarteilia canceri]